MIEVCDSSCHSRYAHVLNFLPFIRAVHRVNGQFEHHGPHL